ncbi:hypothetical protein BE20_05125 [Sorangium cellulosum]|uniref:catalase n=1 Tax=Sorangium cellulosum TaxID=56 RepID=A0A150SR15_SORCE|nr:hypothetical protein BE18_47300 [Sorangium cellulosum]KYF94915.1 hypothetical protein BE20_05125 [Sorangium cellulosum]
MHLTTRYTKARFLQDPSIKTPVLVRFSTVAGSRGSADTVRGLVVSVNRVGKLVLHRNPTNFFAETEQVAFCVQNVVPGIELLRARGIDGARSGVVTSSGGASFVASFIDAIRRHRHWGREDLQAIPA